MAVLPQIRIPYWICEINEITFLTNLVEGNRLRGQL